MSYVWKEKWVGFIDHRGQESGRGFVTDENENKVRIQVTMGAEAGDNIVRAKKHCCILPDHVTPDEAKDLIDLALDIWDEDWFNQLTADLNHYKWRKANGERPKPVYPS